MLLRKEEVHLGEFGWSLWGREQSTTMYVVALDVILIVNVSLMRLKAHTTYQYELVVTSNQ